MLITLLTFRRVDAHLTASAALCRRKHVLVGKGSWLSRKSFCFTNACPEETFCVHPLLNVQVLTVSDTRRGDGAVAVRERPLVSGAVSRGRDLWGTQSLYWEAIWDPDGNLYPGLPHQGQHHYACFVPYCTPSDRVWQVIDVQ